MELNGWQQISFSLQWQCTYFLLTVHLLKGEKNDIKFYVKIDLIFIDVNGNYKKFFVSPNVEYKINIMKSLSFLHFLKGNVRGYRLFVLVIHQFVYPWVAGFFWLPFKSNTQQAKRIQIHFGLIRSSPSEVSFDIKTKINKKKNGNSKLRKTNGKEEKDLIK